MSSPPALYFPYKRAIPFAFPPLVETTAAGYTPLVASLYIVATPIGNLGDMTFRALETLKAADVVACEDTRHTLQLLTHFDIRKPLISCRAQNEAAASQKIIALLQEGKNVAYASDAGTPAISDPGAALVSAVRSAGFTVIPIPGASAFAALASVAGSCGKTLIFEGFLSPKPGRRRTRLKELLETGDAIILYESPYRLVKLLTDIADIESGRRIIVGREMTKLHEEIIEGVAEELAKEFGSRDSVKGECAILISGIKNCKKFTDLPIIKAEG